MAGYRLIGPGVCSAEKQHPISLQFWLSNFTEATEILKHMKSELLLGKLGTTVPSLAETSISMTPTPLLPGNAGGLGLGRAC